MDRLASCYFCGVAVEAPLEEYPVVPRDLDPSVEDQSTVVLCPDCRRKLSTIVERVVAATNDPAQTELGDAVTGDATLDAEDVSDTTATPGAKVERFDEERTNLVDFESSHDREPGTYSREASADDDTDTADPAETSADDAVSAETDDEVDGSATANTTSDPLGASNEPTPDRQQAGTAGHTESDSDVGDDTDTDPGATAERREKVGESQDRAFSTSSYNKVVRLLQNREFPVEADEIVTVAGSAYGIGHREANEVLDALVERGVLDRDGDRLRRDDE
ncbi:MAG: hypothetical protein ABEI98_02880 [Halorhabdus sp.]